MTALKAQLADTEQREAKVIEEFERYKQRARVALKRSEDKTGPDAVLPLASGPLPVMDAGLSSAGESSSARAAAVERKVQELELELRISKVHRWRQGLGEKPPRTPAPAPAPPPSFHALS
jgi:hypothetical protein